MPCQLKPTLPFLSSDPAGNSWLLAMIMMTVYFGDYINDTAECVEEHA
jgi:hypothetical protein